MPTISYRTPGAIGIVRDIPATDLPPEAWSYGENVTFKDQRVNKRLGHATSFSTELQNTAQGIHFILPLFQEGGEFSWVVVGLEDAWTLTLGSLTKITNVGGVYTGAATDRWNGAVLSDVVILNNGVDPPQQKLSSQANLVDLDFVTGTSTWDNTDGASAAGGSGLTAKVMRSFREYLVALNTTDKNTSINYPQRVQWSHAAVAGSVPDSWDPTDDTRDAGFFDIVETPDFVVDCLTLRDLNIIYKESTTWSMRYVGPPRVFEFYKILSEHGMMAQQCAVTFNNQHCVKTLDDLIVHNGQQLIVRLLDKKWRSFLQNDIDADNYLNSFMIDNHREYEIWFCYPENFATYCTKALIWNYQDNTFSVRDLPDIVHAATGVVRTDELDTIASYGSQPTSELSGPYDIRYYDPISKHIMMSEYQPVGTNGVLYKPEITTQFNGQNYVSRIQRLGLPMTADKSQKMTNKVVRQLIPYVEASTGDVMQFRIGSQQTRNDEVKWQDWQDYTLGTDRKIDLNVVLSGNFIAFDMKNETSADWQFDGFDISFDIVGIQ